MAALEQLGLSGILNECLDSKICVTHGLLTELNATSSPFHDPKDILH
jgi:hypothetical protein